MPKNRPMARADILSALPWKPTSNGMFPGGMIARHSIPGDRISVIALDAITVHAGELKSGTLHSGNRDGAHVSIGDKVYGIQMFNESKQLMFALSWLDGSFRLGLPGKPGVYMQNGDVHIDGSVLVDGTVTATKIQTAGELSRVILENDMILVGSGELGQNFSGFAITENSVGGYNNNVQTVGFDSVTGHIISVDPAGAENTYINIGDGKIYLSNPKASVAGGTEYPSQLIFRSITIPEEGEPMIDDIGMWSDGYGLNIVNPDGLSLPQLRFISQDDDVGITLGSNGLTFSDDSSLRIFGSGTFSIYDFVNPIVFGVGAALSTLRVNSSDVEVRGGILQFTPRSGVWASQPAPSTETRAVLWFDGANGKWLTEIEGAWYSLDMTAV